MGIILIEKPWRGASNDFRKSFSFTLPFDEYDSHCYSICVVWVGKLVLADIKSSTLFQFQKFNRKLFMLTPTKCGSGFVSDVSWDN